MTDPRDLATSLRQSADEKARRLNYFSTRGVDQRDETADALAELAEIVAQLSEGRSFIPLHTPDEAAQADGLDPASVSVSV